MASLLKKIDMYGTDSFFHYKGGDTFPTAWGGASSLISILLTLAISAYYIQLLFNKDDPSIYYQTFKGVNNKTLFEESDINEGIFPIFLRMNNSVIDHRYLYVELILVELSGFRDVHIEQAKMCDLNEFPAYSREDLKRNTLVNLNENKTNFEITASMKYFCFSTKNISMAEYFFNSRGEYNFYVTIQYYGAPEEAGLIDSLTADLFFFNHDYDLSLYPDPMSHNTRFMASMEFYNSSMYTYMLVANNLIIETDTGWINEDLNRTKSFMFQNILSTGIYNYEPNAYILRLEIALDEYSIYYKRKYMKLPECLSLIGGLQAQVSLFFALFMSFINKIKMKEDVINSMFEFQEKKLRSKGSKNASLELEKEESKHQNSPPLSEKQKGSSHSLIEINKINSSKVDAKYQDKDNSIPKFVQVQFQTNENNLRLETVLPTEKEKINNNENPQKDELNASIKKLFKDPPKKKGKVMKLRFSFCESLLFSFMPCCLKTHKKDNFKELDEIIDRYFDVFELIHYLITVDKHQIKLTSIFPEDGDYFTRQKFLYEEGYKIEDYAKAMLVTNH